MSDIYNQNDNPTNPYSQFSEVGSDSVYQGRSNEEVERRKKALTAGLIRFEKTPFYIETKQAQQLKSNLIEAATLKQDMCLACTGSASVCRSGACYTCRPSRARTSGSTSQARRAPPPMRRPGHSTSRSATWVCPAGRTRIGQERSRTTGYGRAGLG